MASAETLTPSMWLRYANRIRLISAKTAQEIVRMIVRDEYGQAELDRNEPLSIYDEGETWLVSGSFPKAADPSDPQWASWAGPIAVRISKFDAQIRDYSHTILPNS
jgi:hypothetical protein